MDSLSFNLDLYFTRPPGAFAIELALVRPAWVPEQDGIRRAWEYMSRAAKDECPKPEPISVIRTNEGTLSILDGNATYAVARGSNWPRILAVEFKSREDFERSKASSAGDKRDNCAQRANFRRARGLRAFLRRSPAGSAGPCSGQPLAASTARFLRAVAAVHATRSPPPRNTAASRDSKLPG